MTRMNARTFEDLVTAYHLQESGELSVQTVVSYLGKLEERRGDVLTVTEACQALERLAEEAHRFRETLLAVAWS